MKRILPIIGGFALFGVSLACAYLAGQQVGRRDTFREEAAFRMGVNTSLYLALQRGNLDQAKSSLEMLILGATRTYEAVWPVESRTNLADIYPLAAEISAQVETNLVVMNHSFIDRINEKMRREEAERKRKQREERLKELATEPPGPRP